MFAYFNKLVKNLSFVDIKIIGLVGICVGLIVANFWNPNIWYPIAVGVVLYVYIAFRLFR